MLSSRQSGNDRMTGQLESPGLKQSPGERGQTSPAADELSIRELRGAKETISFGRENTRIGNLIINFPVETRGKKASRGNTTAAARRCPIAWCSPSQLTTQKRATIAERTNDPLSN